MDIFSLWMIVVLIALTGFFVASEFAIVKVRPSRIDQLIEEGNKKAEAAKHIITHLDEYLSANQLGITMTSLGLGWLGEPAVERALRSLFESLNVSPSFAHGASFFVAFATITFVHVVVGELAPKTIAIQRAEAITLWTARPLMLFYRVMYPFIWLLNESARLAVRLFGFQLSGEKGSAHSEEELRLLLSASYRSGEINHTEYKYVSNIFRFDDRVAKEIMVPRKEIVAFDVHDSLEHVLQTIREEKYTRYPIIDGDKDHVLGLVNVKELFTDLVANCHERRDLREYIRPIIQVIETIPIQELLVKMQKERIHMAILVDEYGGTSGLVTVEDILEEIVGEIRDEFDTDEAPLIQVIDENRTIVDGKVLISEINDLFGLEIDDTDVDTIGGWMLTERYNIRLGEHIEYGDYCFTVRELDGHHIKKIEVTRRCLTNDAHEEMKQEAAL